MSALRDATLYRTVKYHHVGSGVTASLHFCPTCDGWYGVPHDDDVHTKRHHESPVCACRPCQERFGRYPTEGVMVSHVEYLRDRAVSCPG